MLTEVSPNRYVVKLNGMIVSPTFFTTQSAQQYIFQLPHEQQLLAEVVIVDQNNKELLLG